MFKKKLLIFLVFILAAGAVVAADSIELNDVQTEFIDDSSGYLYSVEYVLNGITSDDCKAVTYFYNGDILIKNTTEDLTPENGKCEVKTNCSFNSKKNIDHVEIHVMKDGQIIFNQSEDFDMTVEEPEEESSSVTYVASSNSDKFHTPGCQWAKKIKDSNKITFPDRDSALNSGYRACSVCQP